MEAWQFSAISEATGDREVHIRFYSQVWGFFLSAMVLVGLFLIARVSGENSRKPKKESPQRPDGQS